MAVWFGLCWMVGPMKGSEGISVNTLFLDINTVHRAAAEGRDFGVGLVFTSVLVF